MLQQLISRAHDFVNQLTGRRISGKLLKRILIEPIHVHVLDYLKFLI